MKIFKSRLCLLLSFILASQTILYANPVDNKHEYTIEECKNIIRIKMLEPRIEAIDTALKSGLLTEQEINDFTAQKYHLQSETTKSLPIGVTPEEYIEKIYDSKQSVVQNKSSGGGGSSSSTPQIADTFSKKLILSGLDVINEELSMATTSDSILKLNNMKDIFNELFNDCRNDNITFPREYTEDEKIDIITRLNNEVGKQTGSSLKSSNINSWNTKMKDVNKYGEPLKPIGIYCAMVENPNQNGVYGVFCELKYISSDNCFFGGNVDSEFRINDVLMRKYSDNLGWDITPNGVFGRPYNMKPLYFDEKITTDSVVNIDLKTNILGDYNITLNISNPIYTTLSNDRVKDCEAYLDYLSKKWEPVNINTTTDSVFSID